MAQSVLTLSANPFFKTWGPTWSKGYPPLLIYYCGRRSSLNAQTHTHTITTILTAAAHTPRQSRSQMNWSIVSNHKIYIFSKAAEIWLALGCSGAKSAPNCETYLKMSALSTCWLEVGHTTRQKPPLLLKRSLISNWACHVREPPWRASRCQKTYIGDHPPLTIDILLYSYGNCSVSKAVGLFWPLMECDCHNRAEWDWRTPGQQ